MIQHRFPIFTLLLGLVLTFSCSDRNHHEKEVTDQRYNDDLLKADQFLQQQLHDSAFYYFNRAKSIAIEEGNSDRVVYALIRMSDMQQIRSDFSGSEATATESLHYLQNVTVKAYPAIIYNTLGLAFKGQYDYDNAVKYYDKALENAADELSRCILRNNIAVIYLDKKDHDRAKKILEPLSQNQVLMRNQPYYAKVIDNLGYAYLKTKNPDALQLLTKSMQLRENAADDFELVSVYLHLSEYFDAVDPKQSKTYAFKAYASATKANSVDDRIETLRKLIAVSQGETSKKYAIIRMNLTDSIGRIRQADKNQFAKIRYDDAKTKEENVVLRYEKDKMTYYSIILAGIALLLALLVFIIRYRKKAKHEREKLEAAYDAETRISRKIHDELANDLYNTITYTETHDLTQTDKRETLLKHLDIAYERARDISRENGTINTGEDFPMQLRDMLTEYSSERQKVLVHGLSNVVWNAMRDEKKIILYRVLQELMVNMKKHSGAKNAMLQFETDAKNTIIKYSDNGKGIAQDRLFSRNGLQNVENRINAIGGTIIFDSEPENGLRVTITCPSEN